MSMMKKGKRYLRKADRLSGGFVKYLQDNPLLAAGLVAVVGTMGVSKGGDKLTALLESLAPKKTA